jgi:hypothetical protein
MPHIVLVRRKALLLGFASLALAACSPQAPHGEAEQALNNAPTLYSDPQRQSPVKAEPGEPLVLPGVNLSTLGYVVYLVEPNTQLPPVYPGAPPSNTSTSGKLLPLRVDANAVTVALPTYLTANQSYAIWYVNQGAGGNGDTPSNPIFVNDARPSWFSPGVSVASDGSSFHAYQTQSRPGLTRDVKIIGRNFQPAAGSQTTVTFTPTGSSGSPFTLSAQTTSDDLPVQEYVIRATLPASVTPGTYNMTVSRDGTSSVMVPSPFYVHADPSPNPTVTVSGCSPDDGMDDTGCITAAISSAISSHQSTGLPVDVVFPPGTWNFDDGVGTVTLPQWINLKGSVDANGAWLSTVVVGSASVLNQYVKNEGFVPRGTACSADSDCGSTNPLLPPLLRCRNNQCQYDCQAVPCATGQCVSGGSNGDYCLTPPATVSCPSHYSPIDTNGTFTCEATKEKREVFWLTGNNVVENLHFTSTWAVPLVADSVVATQPIDHTFIVQGDNVTLTNDAFDGDYLPIFDNPASHHSRNLVVTNNTISGWYQSFSALGIAGSVISGNQILPGAYAGQVAGSNMGSSQVEITHNTFDGRNNAFAGSQFGFRAAWFANSAEPNEQMLMSQNQIYCVGTRLSGDQGEAIGFDGNGSLPGFFSAQLVSSAMRVPSPSPTAVLTLSAAEINPLEDLTQKWVSVVAGPGLGESRKIVGVNNQNGVLTLTVWPSFDVPLTTCTGGVCASPSPSPNPAPSRIQITSAAWQVYELANLVDNTKCLSQVLTTNAGQLGFFVTAFDSVVAKNQQYDTIGIYMQPTYEAYGPAPTLGTLRGSYANVFSGNFIYNPDENLMPYGGGIIFEFGSATLDASGAPLPTYAIPAFDNIISHNQLENAGQWQQSWKNNFAGISFFGNSSCGTQCNALENPPGLLDTLIYQNTLGLPSVGNAGVVVENDPTVNPPDGTFVCSDNAVTPSSATLAVGNTLQCQ